MVIAMSTTNEEYWRRRYERIKEESIEQADMTAEDIETAMRKALKRIVKEINDWYARYAKDNHITLEEAQKILNARELEAFQMTLDEYIEQANDENLSDEHKKMLEQASTRVRLDRTQQLYISVVHELERLATMENHALEQLLEEVYKDSSYKIAFETQSAQKEYKVPRKIDPHRVQIIIHRPWASDGKDFSERIWHDRDKLAKTLQVDLLQATVSGQGSEEVTRKVAKRMGVAASNARRLVHTETARIHEAAFVDTMDDANIDKLEISATLDMKTSQICQHMDGKIVATKDAKPGITIPPFHCNCRTTTIPYFDDLELEGSTRVARDPKTGKSVRVSGDLTYHEWHDTFVKGENTNEEILKRDTEYKSIGETKKENPPLVIKEDKVNKSDTRLSEYVKDGKINVQELGKRKETESWRDVEQRIHAYLSSEYFPWVFTSRQDLHELGNKEYDGVRSYFDKPIDIEGLKRAVKGKVKIMKTKNDDWSKKIIVDISPQYGYNKDKDTGAIEKSSVVTIHCSNKGIHVVPTRGGEIND